MSIVHPKRFGSLRNMKVGSKILAGFGLVLTGFAVVIATSHLALVRINDDFDAYAERAEVAKLAAEINGSFGNLRHAVIDFAAYGGAEDLTLARSSAATVQERIAQGLKLIKAPESRQKIEHADEQARLYIKNFEKVVAAKAEFAKILRDTLDPTGSRLSEGLQQIIALAARAEDAGAEAPAREAWQHLMILRLSANKVLGRQDQAAAKEADKAAADLTASLKTLDGAIRTPTLRKPFDDIKELPARYIDGYQHSSKLGHEIETLLHKDMGEEASELAEDILKVRDVAFSEQAALSDDLHMLINRTEWLNLVIALTAIVGGIALAFLIGRGISRPVIGMTRAMNDLAGGNTATEIPGVGRRDEIGEMAAAVVIFKDNMLKAERLSAEQRAEQEKKERRTQAVEGYIATFDQSVASALKTLAAASTELQTTAQSMSATAEETQRQSTAVAAASEQATSNVQTVASAAEELSSSIAEIGRQVAESTRIARTAVEDATRTNTQIKSLAEAAQKIGDVVSLINDIASQTNLLALNATIEAARAGEAGKGFAVVASEVKSLATQTAKATEDIAAKVAEMQSATGQSVQAIDGISVTIGRINEIATTIAAAVEQQGGATQEIARNVQQASAGTAEVSSSISNVTKAAADTGAAASQVLSSSGDLAQQAETLRREVDDFLAKIRAA